MAWHGWMQKKKWDLDGDDDDDVMENSIFLYLPSSCSNFIFMHFPIRFSSSMKFKS